MKYLVNIFVGCLFLLNVMCGTFVGNPDSVSEGGGSEEKNSVVVTSGAYTFDDTAVLNLFDEEDLDEEELDEDELDDEYEFLVCVKGLQILTEGATESAFHTFNVGLIDLSSMGDTEWGTILIEKGTRITELTVVTGSIPSLCGFDYSVKFRDEEATEDVLMRWKFTPALEVTNNTAAIELNLQPFARSLRDEHKSGRKQFIKEKLEEEEYEAEDRDEDELEDIRERVREQVERRRQKAQEELRRRQLVPAL